MIINYDRGPGKTIDEKLDSLIQNLHLALNEIEDRLHEKDKEIEALRKEIESLRA